MKDLIIVLISFTLGYFTAVTDVYAQTQYFYGSQGQSAGTAIKSGNSTYFYGPQGQSVGTAIQSGNSTYLYGSQGQSAGTVINSAVPVYTPIPMYTPPTQSLTPMFDSVFGR
jgi:ABC-type cobalt transport system substrate-binding protein